MKTIERAASIYAEPIASDLSHKNMDDLNICDLEDYIAESFKAGVEFAQQWIKIDDELPNDNEIVITIRKKLNGKTYYHLNSIKDGKWNIAIPDTSDVTHWRYIDLK